MCVSRINGSIPDSIASFTQLYYLSLRNNSFSGSIPPFNLANLTYFDVSNNNLSGPVPSTLARFGPSAFLGNLGLCGAPLAVCPGTIAPTSGPVGSLVPPGSLKSSNKLSTGAIAGVVVGTVAFLVLVAVLLLFFCLCRKKRRKSVDDTKPEMPGVMHDRAREKGVEVVTEEYYSATGEKLDRNKLIFFDDKRYSFDLEDLLRASAEVLGKGSVGTAYKAILEDGTIMAVKRLKDVTSGKKEFESQIQIVGKMQHRNLVPLRAYYFSKDEKLLVYDFMQSGSLSALLHGKPW